MKTDLHVVFPGTCDAAFGFYEKVFGGKRMFTMTYGQAPPGAPVPDGGADLVMHTAIPLGSITLMDAIRRRASRARSAAFTCQ